MRKIIFALAALLGLSSLAQAQTNGPVFGGQAVGTFEVADQSVDFPPKAKFRIQPVNACSKPDCSNLFRTANLPVSGKKP